MDDDFFSPRKTTNDASCSPEPAGHAMTHAGKRRRDLIRHRVLFICHYTFFTPGAIIGCGRRRVRKRTVAAAGSFLPTVRCGGHLPRMQVAFCRRHSKQGGKKRFLFYLGSVVTLRQTRYKYVLSNAKLKRKKIIIFFFNFCAQDGKYRIQIYIFPEVSI